MSIFDSYRVATRYRNMRPTRRKTYRQKLRVLNLERRGNAAPWEQHKFYAHGDPLPLHVAGSNKLVAFACHHCGQVHSTKFLGIETARQRALECCRRPARCGCGAYLKTTGMFSCDACYARKEFLTDQKRARKARIIEDDGEPVWSPWGAGEWGDGYSSDLDAHLLSAEDDGLDPPPFVCATRPMVAEVDIEAIYERIAEDQHEDFEPSDLPGYEALCQAIHDFNAQQRVTSFEADWSRIIVVDQARFKAFLETDANGVPDLRYTPTDKLGAPPQTTDAMPDVELFLAGEIPHRAADAPTENRPAPDVASTASDGHPEAQKQ